MKRFVEFRGDLQHVLDVILGRVRLDRPVVCSNPRCKRERHTVSEFEASLLAEGFALGCTCGHGMRKAPPPPGIDLSHIARAARHYGDGEQP